MKIDNKKQMSILLLSEDYRKAVTAFRVAITAVSKGMEVSMFFTSCGLKAVKKNKRLWLPGLLRPFTWIAIWQMEKAGIDRLDLLRESAQEFGVSFSACKSCASALRITKTRLREGVELVEIGKYIELVKKSDVHLVIS